jgi:hypothetical protein
MRHFLAMADAPPPLARGVMYPPAQRLLIAHAGGPHARAARGLRACALTVALAMIAAPADPQLPLAARTVQQPVADDRDHAPSRRQHTGQRAVIASLSLQRDRRLAAIARRSLR